MPRSTRSAPQEAWSGSCSRWRSCGPISPTTPTPRSRSSPSMPGTSRTASARPTWRSGPTTTARRCRRRLETSPARLGCLPRSPMPGSTSPSSGRSPGTTGGGCSARGGGTERRVQPPNRVHKYTLDSAWCGLLGGRSAPAADRERVEDRERGADRERHVRRDDRERGGDCVRDHAGDAAVEDLPPALERDLFAEPLRLDEQQMSVQRREEERHHQERPAVDRG